MTSPVRIEKVGEQASEAGVVHNHDVFEGDTKVGSFSAVTHEGKLKGFKAGGGLKTKHTSAVFSHLKATYGDITKALPAATTTAEPSPDMKPVTLDHDRRRIIRAAQALLGKVETPHTPDGKVNKSLDAGERDWLAKAVAAQTVIDDMRPKLNQMARDLTSRQEFAHPHDKSAHFLMHAYYHMGQADKHLNRPKPSAMDRVRSFIGLEPGHQFHIRAANHFMDAASQMMDAGDAFVLDGTKKQVTLDREAYKLVNRVTEGQDNAIHGAADRLRRSILKQDAATAAAAAAAPKAKAPRQRKPKP